MLRSALTSRSLAILAVGFLTSASACTPSSSNDGSGGNNSGSGGSGSGGNKGSGGSSSGSGGSSAGSGGKVGSGGSGSGGSSTGSGGSSSGSGGSTTGSGGSGTTGSGGSGTTGSGGSGTTGSGGSGTTGSGGSGTTGSGGSGTTGSGGSGTTGSGGAGGGSGNPSCPTASANIISDFEEGTTGVTINPAGGVWYDYKGTVGTQVPASVAASMTPTGIATSTDGTGTCKGAMHVTGMGLTDYSGFGATLAPAPTSAKLSFANPINVSAHSGISFKIKSGSGTPAAVYFDIKTKETAPMAEGGNLSDETDSTKNTDSKVGLRNNRGQMLLSPWTTPSISTSWQTITVPFGTLIPRWVPAGGTMGCPAAGTGVPKCEAPRFNPMNLLGIEFSIVPDPGFPKPSGSSPGTYDLWVDDVQFVDSDSGLPTIAGFPNDGAVGSCVKPTGAAGKFLVTAYNMWKQTFVTGGKVVRPENNNDTVSEGIAYGMIIAVYMNDQALFDQLNSYWKSNATAGHLMTWNNTGGSGSATDADEDAAFALMEASKKWTGGTYSADAMNVMHDILSNDMVGSTYIKGGSNYSGTGSVTNPSYFAPGHYTEFAKFDTTNAATWNGLASASYTLLNADVGASKSGTNGLLAAWCVAGSCAGPAANTDSTNDVLFQYDSHRIPLRVGLDYCWHGTAAAKTYLAKISGFFQTQSANGIARLADIYTPSSSSPASGAAPNSASAIGSAAVGAMSDAQYQTFLDGGYQLVLDMLNRGTLANYNDGTKSAYSYYNATVGMLSLLAMTGNLRPL
ncbi:MAG TPA: glycosyl hydrolase family 8 [Polyangia bacterium]|jgi:endo-1,4-beta-D-glucanase Y